MKTHERVITLLNESLKHQLAIANQYAIHVQHYQHQQLDKLYRHEKQEQVDRTAIIDRLVSRILALKGQPALHSSAKLRIGKDPLQILRFNLLTERMAAQQLQAAIAGCRDCADQDSTNLLLDILDEADDQISWLENQLALSAKIGLHNYLRIQKSLLVEKAPVPESQTQSPYRPTIAPLLGAC